MAYVRRLYELEPLERKKPHSEVDCSWRLARRGDDLVVQLDTYGSASRKDPGTISQSLQLDEQRAGELVAVLRAAFPSLR